MASGERLLLLVPSLRLGSRACPSCSVALKACSSVLVWLVVSAVREQTLWHRSTRARMFLRTRVVGTAVRYLYSLLLACSCVLVMLVQQYGIYTRSCCSVVLKACSCAPDALSSLIARSHALVYLWCWYSSMVPILAPPALSPRRQALCTYFQGVCWYNSIMVSILVQSSYG